MKKTGRVIFEMEGEIIAEFDYSDLVKGACDVEYTVGSEELIKIVLEGCVGHIESLQEFDDIDKDMVH